MIKYYAPILTLFFSTSLAAQGPEVTGWILNQGETGSYYVQGNSTTQTMTTLADVGTVQYDATDVYVSATGIPAYPTGPFLDGNPSLAADNAYIFRIPRVPQAASGNNMEAPLGHIGVLINGVPIFNAEDAMSYNNAGVWLRNAVYWESTGMDCSKGHPAPSQGPGGVTQGRYHHHQNPIPFSTATVVLSGICNMYPADGLYDPDPNMHAPLIGFAFDGYPIYGCFGYDDPNDPNSGIRRIESSWQLRNITQRHDLADGTVLNSSEYGPNVNAQYPLGCFIEDYEYVAGSGDLDAHNGRSCKTPEYPNGTYAYFATVDADLNSAYPYFIGPTYYGDVATDNFPTPGPGNPATNVTIPGGTTQWTGNTGIAALGTTIALHAAPNPTTDRLRVQLPTGTNTLRLRDLGGALVRAWRPHGTEEWIDLADLAPGSYVLESDGIGGRGVVQIMKL
ncbi:MAG: YHYH protein [Flavobacteriales bacterium]|nr:YHYH protein [Flavobacteriales bacterium]MCB9193179.1 YHYH protein [Flavobacteriales bacterium]